MKPIPCFILSILAAIFFGGCRGALPAPPRSAEPEFARTPSGAEILPYGAWKLHTSPPVGEDLFPVFEPRGHGVVFSSNRHGPDFKLYLRGSEGTSLRRVSHGRGHDLYAAIEPQGERIVFVSTRDGGPRLHLLAGLDDSSPRRLGDADVDALHPSWSPDGTAIAYSRLSSGSGSWEIWVIDLETSQPRFVTDGLFPEFHPDGDQLVFQRARRRDGDWFSIWTCRLDGSHQSEIVAGVAWGAVNPSYSPDGRWIVFNSVAKSAQKREQTTEGDDIWCIQSNGEGLTRLTFRETPEWNPHWGRDGRIYFTARHQGTTGTWSLKPTGLSTAP